MHHLADYLQTAVTGAGGLGGGLALFFVSLCDSSFLSLPEINDVLVVYLCTRFKGQAYFYALLTTLGSVAGCSLLFHLAKSGGYAWLRRIHGRGSLDRALRAFQRYGVLAVIVPALLPPPLPFKVFVITAGVMGLPFLRFFVAVLLARGFRYFLEAALAIQYGDRAMLFLKDEYVRIAVVVILAIGVGFAVVVWSARSLGWRRAQQ